MEVAGLGFASKLEPPAKTDGRVIHNPDTTIRVHIISRGNP